jgi:Tripartite tricarboxylate transporter family receptor
MWCPSRPVASLIKSARIIAQKVTLSFNQPVVVDNRAGGNAMIGADIVAKAPADGCTWLGMTITHSINATLFPQAPYNFLRDLSAVSVLGSLPLVVVVTPGLPVKTLQNSHACTHCMNCGLQTIMQTGRRGRSRSAPPANNNRLNARRASSPTAHNCAFRTGLETAAFVFPATERGPLRYDGKHDWFRHQSTPHRRAPA